jgi:NAD+ diphosphatase
MEPGESFEDAVRREMWEEAGVSVRNVRYHSTQPWPMPANLMVGFYCTADASQPLRLDLDNELEGACAACAERRVLTAAADAQWVTREEVLKILAHPRGTDLSRRPDPAAQAGGAAALAHSDPQTQKQSPQGQPAAAAAAGAGADDPPYSVPPRTAIAGVLIAEWAEGKVAHWPPEKEGVGRL